MGFDNSNSGSEDNPLRFPVASGKHATLWVKEGEEEFYFSVKVELPFFGEENFNMFSTDKSSGYVNQAGQAWKEEVQNQ